jgi:uroporphyrin-III C-methyltransferase / precorrin-2 dehydrogenase / sirohydrochlorin ferrochelatase
MAFGYPVMLELQGRRCVVIGGGAVGEGKVRGLLEAKALVTVIAPELTAGLDDLARGGSITVLRRPYAPGDLEGAFLAIAATDDSATNAQIFDEANERGALLNAVDDIDHCHFAAPSVIRRGDLIVALSTGGKAPALAKQLRRKLASQFSEDYATLLDLLGEVRQKALSVRKVDFQEWARRWERAMERDLLQMVKEGRIQEAKDLLWSDLNGPEPAGNRPGFVWIVGAGPGDPELITLKGRSVLDRADVVVYDRLVSPELIEGKEAIYAGKAPGSHSAPQEEINALLIRLATEGKQVVRLKGGDPFVFGRGGEEAEALAASGIEYSVVPGPSSATAALAAAGIPVTDRRYASSVTIVTGHCGGPETVDWKAIAASSETIVILMGMKNIEDIARQLLEGGLSPQTPAAIVENGTLPSQRVVVSQLEDLSGAASAGGFGSPAVIVVGEVVRLRERLLAVEQIVVP